MSSPSPFRPIVPAQPHMDVYAGSCNPPRRAKRARADDASSPSQPDDDGDDLPPKRRGRRPGTLSRAAREAQRKANHSLIEKARRTKINDALAALRELVPPEYKRPSESHPDDSDDDDKHRPKTRAPEFKLEILVRTVAYLQDLTDRARQLEHDGCPRCSAPISFAADDASSRKRCGDSPSPSPRLPSISAWLPSAVDHPPAGDSARATQLPTPPTSVTCPPASAGFPLPPVLTLPSPTTRMQPRFSGFTPRAKPSPAASPVHTPDDETAASLLLRMSTTSPRGVVAETSALTPSRLLGLSADR